MTYELKYDPGRDLIICQTSGDFNIAVVEKLTAELYEIIKLYKCKKILNDLRQLDTVSSVFDVYDIRRIVRHAKIPSDCKRALLVTQLTENYRFFETDLVRSGQDVKFFTDLETALEWLQQTHI